MLDVTPTTTRSDAARLLALLVLPVLLAFATGALAALVFADGALSERSEQEVNELLAELRQVRRSEAWLMTLSAQYIQATEHCEAAAATRVTAAGTGGAR